MQSNFIQQDQHYLVALIVQFSMQFVHVSVCVTACVCMFILVERATVYDVSYCRTLKL